MADPTKTQSPSADDVALPLVDWRRTLGAAAAITVLTGAFGAIAIVDQEGLAGDISAVLSALTGIGGTVGLGYWLGRTSRASGFFGSVVLGLVAGAFFASMIGATGGVVGFAVAMPVFGAAAAGWAGSVGYRVGNPYRGAAAAKAALACPHCGEVFPIGVMLKSKLLFWIACRECRSSLVGNGPIQLLALLEFLVLGATVLAIAYYITITSILSNESRIGDLWLIPLAALALLVGRRILVPPLARRYGSYRILQEGERTPRLLRVYVLATGLVSVAILAVMVLYAGFSTGGDHVLIASVFVPFLLLFPLYELELGRRLRTAAVAVLLVWSGSVIAFGVVFTAFAVYNFPKEQPFTDDLWLTARRLSEHDAWRQLTALGNDETTDRETFLEFFGQNVVSIPDEDYRITLKFSDEIPQVVRYTTLVNEELEEIEALGGRGLVSEANSKYLRLWRVADNMASGNIMLIQSLVSAGMASSLIAFYVESDGEYLRASMPEIMDLSSSLESRLDESFRRAFILEHIGRKDLVENLASYMCLVIGSDYLEDRCDREWEVKWPFFDAHRYLRSNYDVSIRLISAFTGPFGPGSSTLEDARGDAESEERLLTPSVVSLILNPIGSALDNAIVPLLGPLAFGRHQAQSKLAAFRFILHAEESESLGSVPIDPLTGQPFTLIDNGDTIEITSSYFKDGEPAVRYEFKKP